MPRRVFADLHVHSALSPCAAGEMRPPEVLLTAEGRGVGLLGIVDHSTARNAPAFLEASQAFDVRVLVGLEVESAEGVHILALFDSADAALDMDAVVAQHLPPRLNRPDILGPQHLLDEWGELQGYDERLLVTAVDLTIEQIADLTAARNGLSIPAHIDRSANGLMSVLGFVPPDLHVELLEVSRRTPAAEARARWPQLREWGLVTGSDAHSLEEVGDAGVWLPWELACAGPFDRQWGEAVAAYLVASA